MTEDNVKDKTDSSDEEAHEEEELMENMEEFVVALNRFVDLVDGMRWPEHFPLKGDQKHCFHVFRAFWRQRARQRRENDGRRGHVHMRFEGMSKEDIQRFFRNRFSRGVFDDDEQPTLDIDPNQHQPDEEHTDEAAKERQQRFRDEWE